MKNLILLPLSVFAIKFCNAQEPKCKMCKEIAYLTKKQAPVQMVPVLFMFGVPQRILKITEVVEYQTLRANVKYIKETEIKL